jgi:hypothetical protein
VKVFDASEIHPTVYGAIGELARVRALPRRARLHRRRGQPVRWGKGRPRKSRPRKGRQWTHAV